MLLGGSSGNCLLLLFRGVDLILSFTFWLGASLIFCASFTSCVTSSIELSLFSCCFTSGVNSCSFFSPDFCVALFCEDTSFLPFNSSMFCSSFTFCVCSLSDFCTSFSSKGAFPSSVASSKFWIWLTCVFTSCSSASSAFCSLLFCLVTSFLFFDSSVLWTLFSSDVTSCASTSSSFCVFSSCELISSTSDGSSVFWEVFTSAGSSCSCTSSVFVTSLPCESSSFSFVVVSLDLGSNSCASAVLGFKNNNVPINIDAAPTLYFLIEYFWTFLLLFIK